MDKERKKDPPNKLTIVGGQPSRKDTPTFSNNIEKLLLNSAVDDKFRTAFLKDRESILEDPEFSLTSQDKAILRSISLPTL